MRFFLPSDDIEHYTQHVFIIISPEEVTDTPDASLAVLKWFERQDEPLKNVLIVITTKK